MSPLPELCFSVLRSPLTAVGLPLALGMGSGFITGQSAKGEWYTRLNQPSFAPPREAFGPVWTALYLGLGYVSHLSVKAFDAAVTPGGTAQADQAIQLYYAQLALNCLWTPLFFGAKKPEVAFANILALTGTSVAMAVQMSKLDTYPISTNWITIPYCLWLTYATYLNAGIILNNRTNKRV